VTGALGVIGVSGKADLTDKDFPTISIFYQQAIVNSPDLFHRNKEEMMKRGVIWIALTVLMVISMVLVSCNTATTTTTTTKTTTQPTTQPTTITSKNNLYYCANVHHIHPDSRGQLVGQPRETAIRRATGHFTRTKRNGF